MKYTGRMIVNFAAFVAVILIGIALILHRTIPNTSVSHYCQMIANIIAYIMLAIFSFFYARSKRNVIFIILWVAAVVLIVVSYII